MNKETLHIDDLLSNSFGGFEPAMPAMAWEGIASKLDAKSKKRGFAWAKAAAVALIVAGSLFSVSQLLDHSSNSESTVNSEKILTSDKNNQNSNIGESSATKNGSEETNSNGNLNGDDNGNSNINPGYNSNSEATNKANGSPIYQSPSDSKQDILVSPASSNTEGSVQIEAWDQIAENNAVGIKFDDISKNDWALIFGETANDAYQLIQPNPRKQFATKESRWMLGLGVGQVISNTNYALVDQYASYVHPFFKKEISKGEGILSALSLNASAIYQLGNQSKWFLIAGVSYFQRKNSVNFDLKQYTLFTDGTKPTDKFGHRAFAEGWIPGGTPIDSVKFKGTNSITQIELPIALQYQINLGKSDWCILPSIGSSIGFITQKSGNTLDYYNLDLTRINSSLYRSNYITVNSSVGIYKNLGTAFKFGVNLSGSYMLSSLYIPGTGVRPQAMTGGLSTQLIWRIDR